METGPYDDPDDRDGDPDDARDDDWGPDVAALHRLRQRADRLLSRVPRATLSHWTAAALHGLPVPLRSLDVVHVTVTHGSNAPARRGVVAHRSRLVERSDLRAAAPGPAGLIAPPVVLPVALPVTPVARTWLDLAGDGATPVELLVVADAAWRAGLVEPEHLSDGLAHRRRGRGAVAARWALERVDRRSWGVDESRLRAVLLRAGLRPTAVGYEVEHDDGTVLARFGLAWPAWRVGVRLVRFPLVRQWAHQVLHDNVLRFGGLAGWQIVDVPDVVLNRRGDIVRSVGAAVRRGRALTALEQGEGVRALWTRAG
ncbi:hypothetical protein [Aquipuribacter sp. SD81]|uniref:hypothetical protein n=1 Tax=Aquipuribacter sp. SD81 TaxID=3127703 RepID=UPI003019DF00